MATAWYLAPYKEHTRPGARVCSMDDASADIFAAGGDWRETPVGGKGLGDTLVAVDAPASVLANLATTFKPVVDPVLVAVAGLIDPINGTQLLPRLPASLAAEASSHKRAQARIEAIVAKADAEGYVRLADPWSHETARLLVELGKLGYGLDRVSTGTFPTTSLLDDYTRADSTTSAGPSWTVLGGWHALGISSNQAYNAGFTLSDVGSYWNPGTFGPDTEVYQSVPTVGTDQSYYTMLARIANPGGTTTRNSYWGEIERQEAQGNVYIETANVGTVLGATTAQVWADGDWEGLEIIGSTISLYRKAAAGSWTLIVARTDTTYAAAGNIGNAIWTAAGTKFIDNFSGGTLVAAAAATLVAAPLYAPGLGHPGTFRRQLIVVPPPAAPTTPVSTTLDLPVEALQGVTQTTSLPNESTQGVATTASTPEEASQAVPAATAQAPIEAAQGVAQTTQEPVEAAGGVAGTSSAPIEELGAIATTGSEPIESVQPASTTATAPIESSQGIASTATVPADAAGGIAATTSEPIEALQQASSTASVPVESVLAVSVTGAAIIEALAGIASSASSPIDEAAGVASTGLVPLEALQGIATTASEPYESAGSPVTPVSQTAVIAIESLAALTASASVPADELGGVATSGAIPLESAQAVSASAAVPLESQLSASATFTAIVEALAGVSRTTSLPLDEAGGVAATGGLPLESVAPASSTAGIPLEAARAIAAVAVSLPLEALTAAAATARMPFESLGIVIRWHYGSGVTVTYDSDGNWTYHSDDTATYDEA